MSGTKPRQPETLLEALERAAAALRRIEARLAGETKAEVVRDA